jgi:hypothetical protein
LVDVICGSLDESDRVGANLSRRFALEAIRQAACGVVATGHCTIVAPGSPKVSQTATITAADAAHRHGRGHVRTATACRPREAGNPTGDPMASEFGTSALFDRLLGLGQGARSPDDVNRGD